MAKAIKPVVATAEGHDVTVNPAACRAAFETFLATAEPVEVATLTFLFFMRERIASDADNRLHEGMAMVAITPAVENEAA